MAPAPAPLSLQRRIDEMQSQRMVGAALPTPDALRPLFPGGGLRKGAAYAVHGSTALGLALLSEASTSGDWCAVVGIGHLGAEAISGLGVALDRCVFIPDPGEHALTVAGALIETIPLVLVRAAPPGHGEAARLAAKLRDSGSALVSLSGWPRAETQLHVTDIRWTGLGQEHGFLATRELSVQSLDRRGTRTHTVRFVNGRIPSGDPSAAPHVTAAPSPVRSGPRPFDRPLRPAASASLAEPVGSMSRPAEAV